MTRIRNDAVARNRRLDKVENPPTMPNQLWDAKTKSWVHTAEDMERVLTQKPGVPITMFKDNQGFTPNG